MRRMLSLLGVTIFVAAGALFGGTTQEDKAKEAAAKPVAPSRLDAIKKLSGEWVEIGEDGKPTDKVVAVYRTTAGGTVVEETLFGGTPHEMVTMYYMDRDNLMLTHYCVAGNQPRMKAEKPTTDANKIVFHCDGGTNMKSENDEHMHHATLVLVDGDHIQSEWLEFKDGKQTMNASFKLARK
jgi:hypothetical protein